MSRQRNLYRYLGTKTKQTQVLPAQSSVSVGNVPVADGVHQAAGRFFLQRYRTPHGGGLALQKLALQQLGRFGVVRHVVHLQKNR